MEYKICKFINRRHTLNKDTQMYELIEEDKFFILRKGTLFGFWHDVGEWLCDIEGNLFCYRDEFKSLEQAKSFLYCWHKETYPNDNSIKIKYKVVNPKNIDIEYIS